jgi:parallel beta-helix repeat protein
VAALAILASGCSGGGSSAAPSSTAGGACKVVVQDLLRLTQRYIDGFGVDSQPRVSASASPTGSPSQSPTPIATPVTEQQYADAISSARGRLAQSGCDIAAFQEAMQSGLQAVKSRGAIATAVLAQLRVSMSGQLSPRPVTRTATPTDDLSTLLAQLPDSSTLVLGKGSYRLPDTLVLLRSITIRGAGPDATILVSEAPQASVLVMTDKQVSLSRLAIRRNGATPGSVVMTGPSARLALRSVSVSGARADTDGAGGVGVLLTAVGSAVANAGTTFTAVDSTFTDNDAAGVAAGGTHRIAITRSTFQRNRQCGVCYLGSSVGTVSGDTFTGNAVGIVVASPAADVIHGNTINGGDIGIQATGESKPVITGNTISGTARAAMVFVNDASGRVDGNDCSGDRTGIAVARTAYPTVATNSCRVTLGQ